MHTEQKTKKFYNRLWGLSKSQLSEKLQYRAISYEAYDNIDHAISERFNQADFLIYKDLQQVFMNAVQGMPYEEEMRRVCKTYSSDVSYGNLAIDIPVFARLVPKSERKNSA